MTEVHEADALISAQSFEYGAETVAIDRSAGRVVAADVGAERDLPAFNRVTMDGIAVRYTERGGAPTRFRIAGLQPAGAPPTCLAQANDCIRVMTGAVLPEGADTVIPVENLSVGDEFAVLRAGVRIQLGQFVHRRGSDRLQNAPLLTTGMVIGPTEIAVLASNGNAAVKVFRRPRVAVISTGDELVGLEDELAPHQIRSSNDRAIETALQHHQLGEITRARLRDDPGSLLDRITELHATHEVLIMSGGVSMGEFDFVPAALERLGTTLLFHRINQKPGRPMWFGISTDGKPIFALPGNPVSTLVCMARYVVPALHRAVWHSEFEPRYVRLAGSPGHGPATMTWFVPVTVESTAGGVTIAHPRAINTSGDFASLAGTDGIVELAADPKSREAGAVVPLYRW